MDGWGLLPIPEVLVGKCACFSGLFVVYPVLLLLLQGSGGEER